MSENTKEPKRIHVWLEYETWRALKMKAINEDRTAQDVLEEIIEDALGLDDDEQHEPVGLTDQELESIKEKLSG